MTHNLKRYSTYKPSGIEWLGDVPAHWEVRPNHTILAEVNERNHPDEQMLSVTITKGVIHQRSLLEDSSKKDTSRLDRSAYKLVRRGDIAYNKMRAWQGAIGASEYHGIVSPAYVVQRPRNGANSRYLHYLLRTRAFAKEAERWSYGITSDMWSLRPEHFKTIYTCVPPLPEQAAIVRFLDHKTAEIDEAISKKQRLIDLLKEQKAILIEQAVTKGLNPNVPMRDSGVEWIGEVPAHWEVLAIKRITSVPITDGPHETPEFLDEGVPFISAEAIKNDRIDFTKRRGFISSKEHARFSKKYKPKRGDIYLIKSGATTGNVAFVDTDEEFNIWSPLAAIRPHHKKATTSFIFYFMKSRNFFQSIELGWSYGTQQNIGMNVIKNLPIVRPPTDEQHRIAAFLDHKTAEIDEAISKKQRQISLLQEYRAILIADVVTGKLDVREDAPHES